MWFYSVLVVVLLSGHQCSGNAINCLEKEKSLGVLDFARQSIEKAEDLFPDCFDNDNSTNSSVCGKKEKAFAFLQIAKDLIAKAEKNYPTCLDVETTVLPDVNTTVYPEVNTTMYPDVNATIYPDVNTTMYPDVNTTLYPDVNTTMYPDVNTTMYPDVNTTVFPDVNTTVLPDVTSTILPKALPIDCTDVLKNGQNTSGVYMVWPRSSLLNNASIRVYCDMETDGGGWTVIQRRGGFSSLQNFNRSWQNYKKGFGDLNTEFWLGNDNIYKITNQAEYEVRFDLTDFEGNKRYAVYKSFQIESEDHKYKLHAKGYKGNAGDSLSYENGCWFSTLDRNNDKDQRPPPCATSRGAGWWFNNCNRVNINGIPNKKASLTDPKNLYWKDWRERQSLATANMKLRRI